MTIHVFIDTNIFLSFFSYNKDDIEELKKIINLIKIGQIKLYLPEQIVREFSRNREAKIQETLKTFKEYKIQHEIPRLMAHYDEVKQYHEAAKNLNRNHNVLMELAKEDTINKSLPADKLFNEIIHVAQEIQIKDEIKKKAEWRLSRGDPPGKGGDLGDRLNWEILLEEIPVEIDLHIVTADQDYYSLFDLNKPHPTLTNEWSQIKKSRLIIYNQLALFLQSYFPDIKISSDIGKWHAIITLISSENFIATHTAVAKLSNFIELLNDAERVEIINAGLDNNQIEWIGKDSDIQNFYSKILREQIRKNSYERLEEAKKVFGLSDDLLPLPKNEID